MNHKIKELLERSVIKMLEEELENSPSVMSSSDGKTIVTMKQNSMVSLLLYLHLINRESVQSNHKESHNNVDETKVMNETASESGVKDMNDEETEDLFQIINDLQQKNNNFHQEIADYFKDKT
ncbi:hypothetical protein [Oceanobacillus profundus]|uniref:Uncharacterized protein n=1 Tax=Oceanobacillus profundus TaxID=372463 RepID=A0A417YAT5_9BACI|nr:hypothetical protein [Oceanobacillus profundus]MCM3397109.1 hypothetical protein [Oceanobacillus profundus]RHW29661.1 hypothetical protein D1B32_20825 [Oceanobacillus profundus]